MERMQSTNKSIENIPHLEKGVWIFIGLYKRSEPTDDACLHLGIGTLEHVSVLEHFNI